MPDVGQVRRGQLEAAPALVFSRRGGKAVQVGVRTKSAPKNTLKSYVARTWATVVTDRATQRLNMAFECASGHTSENDWWIKALLSKVAPVKEWRCRRRAEKTN